MCEDMICAAVNLLAGMVVTVAVGGLIVGVLALVLNRSERSS